MHIIDAHEKLPFETTNFVEAPGRSSDVHFEENLLALVKRHQFDIHVAAAPLALMRHLNRTIESAGYRIFLRMINEDDGQFWLRRRSEFEESSTIARPPHP